MTKEAEERSGGSWSGTSDAISRSWCLYRELVSELLKSCSKQNLTILALRPRSLMLSVQRRPSGYSLSLTCASQRHEEQLTSSSRSLGDLKSMDKYNDRKIGRQAGKGRTRS